MCLNLVKTSDGSKTKCKLEEFDHQDTEFNILIEKKKCSLFFNDFDGLIMLIFKVLLR